MDEAVGTDTREQIINVAEQLFMQYGIRSVTMDDIAKTLTISKKTIYQHFKDKNEIVILATRSALEKDAAMMGNIKQHAQNSVEELVLFSRYYREHLLNVNPSILHDLQKYHPEGWSYFQQFKHQVFIESVEETLVNGIKEGYFRPEIVPKILARYRIEQTEMCFDNEIFPRNQFDFKTVQLQLFDLFVYGIVTVRGRELYEKYSNNNQN